MEHRALSSNENGRQHQQIKPSVHAHVGHILSDSISLTDNKKIIFNT